MSFVPTATEEHRKLHMLAGTWIGEETLSPSPWGPGGPAKGTHTYRVDVDDFYVVGDYTEEKEGKVVFRGHSVFSWDGERKTYVWYWFDSMGFVPAAPSRGQAEGNTLIFEHEPVGDKRGRYTYTFLDRNTFHFKIENSQDAGKSYQQFMEGTYRRA